MLKSQMECLQSQSRNVIFINDEKIMELRGGGCVGQKQSNQNLLSTKEQGENMLERLPNDFLENLKQKSKIIQQIAKTIKEENQRAEFSICYQWLYDSREQLHWIGEKENTSTFYDCILECFIQLLTSCLIYVRTSGLCCFYILKICSDLSKAIFNFYRQNNDRCMKIEEKKNIQNQIKDLESFVQAEAYALWLNGINYYISIIKAAVQIIPVNGNLQLFQLFTKGLITSATTLSPSDDLIKFLCKAAEEIHDKYKEYKSEKLYQRYYNFECLKWTIIAYLKNNDLGINKVFIQIEKIYEESIRDTQNCTLHFLWIYFLSDLLIYRPIIQKTDWIKYQQSLDHLDSWKQFINQHNLKPLPYNSDSIKLSLELTLDNQFQSILQQFGLNNFKSFTLRCIDKNKTFKFKGLDFYVNFRFTTHSSSSLFNIVDPFIYEIYLILFQDKDNENQNKRIESLQTQISYLQENKQRLLELITTLQDQKDNNELNNEIQDLIYKNEDLIFQTIIQFLKFVNVQSKLIASYHVIMLLLNSQSSNFTQKKIEMNLKNEFKNFQTEFQSSFSKIWINLIKSITQDKIFLDSFYLKYNNNSSAYISDTQKLCDTYCKYIKAQIQQIRNLNMRQNQDQSLISSEFIQIQIQFEQHSIPFQNTNKIYEKIKYDDVFSFLRMIETLQWDYLINLKEIKKELQQSLSVDNFRFKEFEIKQISGKLTTLYRYLDLFQQIIEIFRLEYLSINKLVQKKSQLFDVQQMQQKRELTLLSKYQQSLSEYLQFMINTLEKQSSMFEIKEKFEKSKTILIQHYRIQNELKQHLTKFNENFMAVNQLSGKVNPLKSLYQTVKNIDFIESLVNLADQNAFNSEIQDVLVLLKTLECDLNKIDYVNIEEQQNSETDIYYKEILQKFKKDFQVLDDIIEKSKISKELIQKQISKCQDIFTLMNKFQELKRFVNKKEIDQMSWQSIVQNFKLELDHLYIDEIVELLSEIKTIQLFEQLTILDYDIEYLNSILKYLNEDLFEENIDINTSSEQFMKKLIQKQVEEFKDFINNYEYQIRECLVFQLFEIQSHSEDIQVQSYVTDLLLQIWGIEKDQRVRGLLKNKELIQLQKQLFQKNQITINEKLKKTFQMKLKQINDLAQDIRQEFDEESRNQKICTMQSEYLQFQEFLGNINEMQQLLNITMFFIVDIKQDLGQIMNKIEKLQNSINNIGRDISLLKGKSIQQLLEIRKQSVLQYKKKMNLTKIFVPLYGKEKSDRTESKLIPMFDNNNLNKISIVNNFLQQSNPVNEYKDQIDVLLIHGQAGSGKSTIARKIEEYLWEQQESQINKEQNLIPIFVSLPSLKDPLYSAIEETLQSDQLSFDRIQINQLKEEVQKGKISLVIIMDGYDELKTEYSQQNLYVLNRLNEIWKKPKVIYTSRTEILNSNLYLTWFEGNGILKEVELQSFSSLQQNQYFQTFVLQLVKQKILTFYEYCISIDRKFFSFDDFNRIWEPINDIIISKSTEGKNLTHLLLNRNQINSIINSITQNPKIDIRHDQHEELLSNLQKELSEIWSSNRYIEIMDEIQIRQIVQMPFMLEIVAQIFPKLTTNTSDITKIKNNFIKNYVKLKEQSYLINKHSLKLDQVFDLQYQQFQAENHWKKLEMKQIFQNYSPLSQIKIEKQILVINEENFDFGQEVYLIKQALKNQNYTAYSFYQAFIDYYHHQQVQKLKMIGKSIDQEVFFQDLLNFSQSLALELTENQLTQVNYNKKSCVDFSNEGKISQQEWIDKYFGQQGIAIEQTYLLRKCALLNQKGNTISFIHKSIQEFYVSKYIIDLLYKLPKINLDDFNLYINGKLRDQQDENEFILMDKELSSFAKENIQKLIEQILKQIKYSKFNSLKFSAEQYQGMVHFLKDELGDNKNLKEILMIIIKLSCIEQIQQEGGNSFFILNQIGEVFNNQNLGYIQIKNTNLNGAQFYNSVLQKSIFENVNISQCNFNRAQLQNCKWMNINSNELPTLVGHSDSIQQVTFSPDGLTLASASSDKTIRMWNIKSGKEIMKLEGHTKWIWSIGYSPDGQILVSGSGDNSVRIWDVSFGQQIQKLDGHSGQVYQVQFSPNGQMIASCSSDKSIILWDSNSGQQIQKLDGYNEWIRTISFSQVGQLLASGSNDLIIRVWDLKLGLQIIKLIGHEKPIQSIVFSPDSQILASGSEDQSIRLWDIKNGKEIQKLMGHEDSVQSVIFSPDGQILASGSLDTTVRIWDIKSGKNIQRLEGHTKKINSVAYSPDGSILGSASDDQSLRLWDTRSGKEMNMLEGHIRSIFSVSFSPDGLSFVSGGEDQLIKIWDSKSGKELRKLDGHLGWVLSVTFNINGQFIASGSSDCTVRLWDVESGKQILKLDEHTNWVFSVAFSPNDELLASGSDDSFIILWHINTGKVIFKLQGHNDSVQSIAFSIDGLKLASGSSDNLIKIWDTKLGQEILELNECQGQIKCVVFSPDGQLLASAGDDYIIQLWDSTSGQNIIGLEGHTNSVQSIAFYHNSQVLASGSIDNSIRIWDLTTGIEMQKLDGHVGFINSLAFSPNGDILVSASEDNSILLWDTKSIIEMQLINQDNIWIYSIAQSNDQQLIALGCLDYSIKLWDLKTEKEKQTLIGHSDIVEIITFSPNNQIIASAGKDKSIRLWNIKSKDDVQILIAHTATIWSLRFSNDSLRLASGSSDTTIYIWYLKNVYQEKLLLKGHSEAIQQVIFTPDSKILISISNDNTIRQWYVDSGEQVELLEFNLGIAWATTFSPDNQILAIVNKNNIIFLYYIYKKYIRKIENSFHLLHSLAFTYDSDFLISKNSDCSILLIDIKSEFKTQKYHEQSTLQNTSQFPFLQQFKLSKTLTYLLKSLNNRKSVQQFTQSFQLNNISWSNVRMKLIPITCYKAIATTHLIQAKQTCIVNSTIISNLKIDLIPLFKQKQEQWIT